MTANSLSTNPSLDESWRDLQQELDTLNGEVTNNGKDECLEAGTIVYSV
ncbi:MAG TPA: hypothetical protein VIX20_18555 [Ktedonobacteraceae bacterium]